MASDARLSNQLDLFGYELKAVREAFVPAEVAEVTDAADAAAAASAPQRAPALGGGGRGRSC